MKRLQTILFLLCMVWISAVAQTQKPCGTSVLSRHRAASFVRNRDGQVWKRVLREAPQVSFQGAKRGLIILIDFPDQPFSNPDPKALWSAIVNEPHYSNYNAIGSVADYFRDQSYGQFELTFDVIGPVTAKHELAYYGKNIDWGGGDWFDQRPFELVEEACYAVSDSVRFSNYDWNDDGEVEQVFLLYAGHGEDDYWSISEDVIWPHMGSLTFDWDYEEGIRVQNCLIDVYACSSELKKSGALSGIGTICHEFSHCLGLPDLYNTITGNTVLGLYDLMDSGSSGGKGWVPPGYSSYERYACGWLTPETIEDPLAIDSLAPLHLKPDVRFYQQPNFTDYYLIEHRAKESWDVSLPSHGLMVWHIDYDEQAWNDNLVNAYSSRRRVERLRLSDIPTAITTPSADVRPVATYVLASGLFIIRYSDGSIKKVLR